VDLNIKKLEEMSKTQLVNEIISLQEQLENVKVKQLGERVKELNCIYAIARIFNQYTILFDDNTTLEDNILLKKRMLLEIIKAIPAGWQYPEITTVRVTVDKDTVRIPNFQETKWRLESDILLFGKKVGNLEIFYLEQKPEFDGTPFLKEETFLINAITELISQNLERLDLEYRVKTALNKKENLLNRVQENLQALQNVMVDTLSSINDSKVSLQTPSFVQSPIFDAKKAEILVTLLDALSNSERFLIADRIRDEKLDINQIKELINKSQSTCSHHLQLFIKSGLITGWRQKKLTYYSFNQQKVEEMMILWEEWMSSMPFPIKTQENLNPKELTKENIKELEEIINAIGNSERFTILLLLKEEPRNLTTLESVLNRPQSSIYHHLQILKDQALITGYSSGKFTDYRINGERFQYIHNLFVFWLKHISNWV
jgi:DNA-binding transcriptional ArsR family regulator